LLNNNLTDVQINDCLKDLIEYSDKKIRWYTIWIWRKHKVQKNLENRKTALQNTILNLSTIAHPVYTKNRSNI
jgi:hypothetical protein